jgi:predicted nucleic acid-binding protein
MINTLPKVIAVDANFLIALDHPKTPADDAARIKDFLERVDRNRAQIVVPMPAFAEYLVRADAATSLAMQTFEKKAFVRLAPFDRVAAVECANIDRTALKSSDKKNGVKDAWQKVKIDRQIIAIAKANGAKMMISGDAGLRTHAGRNGIDSLRIQDIPLPEAAKQRALPLSGGKIKE